MKNIVKIFLLCLVFILHNNFYAQSVRLDWAKENRAPSPSSGYQGAKGLSIIQDLNGNVYSLGSFLGTVDFDPTSGVTLISGDGMYVQKFDVNSNLIWTKTWKDTAGISSSYTHKIMSDLSGNLYVIGNFGGTKNFDPNLGAINLTSNGILDIFILKLDANGNVIWVKNIGGVSFDETTSSTIDSLGNIHITGSYRDTVDFDPGVGVHNLSTSTSKPEGFVLNLDSSGNFLNVKSTQAIPLSIIYDKLGAIYLVGAFTDTVDVDPDIGVFNLISKGMEDIFVVKLDLNYNFVWGKSMGGTQTEKCLDIISDNNGNIYLTGFFKGSCDFDPGIGTANMYASNFSGFVTKLDSVGNYKWAKAFIGYNVFSNSINIDSNFDVYVTGHFGGNGARLNPGSTVLTLTKSSQDIFFTKLDSSGNYILSFTFGRNNDNYSNSGSDIYINNQNEVFTTGFFSKTIDFDPGPNVLNLQGSNPLKPHVRASYILKFYLCPETYSTLTVNNCGSYIAPSGAILTTSGTYQDVIVNSMGCDSIITINYTNHNSLTFLTIDRCASYTVPSGTTTYTSSGTYTVYDTLTSSLGCDSILNILLSINDQYFSTNGPICDSILNPSMTEWITTNGIYYDTLINIHGCNVYYTDTIQVYQTAYGTNTMSGCESVTSLSGNQIWTTSGTYQDTITTVGPGYCDSIITTTVTINNHSYDTLNPIACYKYVSPLGNTYYNSGTYTNITQNATGCDSVLIINLTILQPSSGGYDSIWVACAPYLSNTGNQTWVSSGTYTDTLYNANSVGCDSVFTVYLTIPVSNIPTLQAYTCDTFVSYSGNQVWTYSGLYTDTIPIPNQYGCDSIIKVNLTKQTSYSIMNVEFCGPANYLSPAGNTYTTSGIYYDTLQNHLGCDSIITVNVYMDIGESYISKINNKLHIYFPNLPPNYYSPNIESQVVLCLTTPWAYNNWEHVNSSNPIANVVVPSKYEFNTRVNLKTNPNIYCYNNIPCHDYTIVGINEHDISEQINVYPNPTDGIVNIDLGKHYSEISINLNDIVGKNIINKTLQNMTLFDLDIQNLPKGVYFIHLLADDKSAVVKIIKN